MFTVAVLIVLLVCATAMDITTERIPNILIIMGCVISFIYQIWILNSCEYVSMILGFILPIFLFTPLFIIKAFGAGDIKLLAVAGLFLGLKGSFYCICYSIVAGGVIALVKILIFGNIKERFTYLIDFLKGFSLSNSSSVVNSNYMGNIDKKNFGAKLRFSLAIFIGVILVLWRQRL